MKNAMLNPRASSQASPLNFKCPAQNCDARFSELKRVKDHIKKKILHEKDPQVTASHKLYHCQKCLFTLPSQKDFEDHARLQDCFAEKLVNCPNPRNGLSNDQKNVRRRYLEIQRPQLPREAKTFSFVRSRPMFALIDSEISSER